LRFAESIINFFKGSDAGRFLRLGERIGGDGIHLLRVLLVWLGLQAALICGGTLVFGIDIFPNSHDLLLPIEKKGTPVPVRQGGAFSCSPAMIIFS
jgi:hypothetical protein